MKNEVENDRETEGEIEEKDKLEKTEKEDLLDVNGNEEQVRIRDVIYCTMSLRQF